jgi:hypothetical protein
MLQVVCCGVSDVNIYIYIYIYSMLPEDCFNYISVFSILERRKDVPVPALLNKRGLCDFYKIHCAFPSMAYRSSFPFLCSYYAGL